MELRVSRVVRGVETPLKKVWVWMQGQEGVVQGSSENALHVREVGWNSERVWVSTQEERDAVR
jgi:hypothetical protein